MTIFEYLGYDEKVLLEISSNLENYYLSYPIKKRKGFRWIDAPLNPLKAIQKTILDKLIYLLPAHPAAVGFVPGKGVKDGAKKHVGANLLICLDIENFFSSIYFRHVIRIIYMLLQKGEDLDLFEIPNYHDTSVLITKLLTYKGALPQGAPSSPALANLYCLSIDKHLQHFADANDLKFSQYADDLSFSTMDENFKVARLISFVKTILSRDYLNLNMRKTRVLRQNKRMLVTGVVVNKQTSVAKKYWRNLRAQIHNIKDTTLLDEKEYQQLRGKISWVHSLNAKRGTALLTQLGQIKYKT